MSGSWLLLAVGDDSLSGKLAWDYSYGTRQSSKREEIKMCKTCGGPGSEVDTLSLLTFPLVTSSNKVNLDARSGEINFTS